MKNYKEIANDIFERREQYITEQRKKKKSIVRITSAICSFVLVALLGVGIWQSDYFNRIISPITDDPVVSSEQQPSNNDNSNVSGKDHTSNNDNPAHKPYPYEDKIQYLPKEILVSKYDSGFFAYNQIKDVDKTILSLYAVLYDNSYLRRECFPFFDEKGNPTFSRISDKSDPDENRFKDMQTFMDDGKDLFYTLSKLPQNSAEGVSCAILQNGYKKDIVAVSTAVEIYSNSVLNVIVSNDFDTVDNADVKTHINKIRSVLTSNTASEINGMNCAISYVYQTRYCEEKNVDEERYIYYAFFEKDGKEYLVQFSSNYALPESNKTAFGNVVRTQKDCKAAFENILLEYLLK